MTMLRMLATLAALVASSTALADTDCADPIDSWKPREALRQQVELRGWTVQRIKVDDGCYEVRGTDQRGNKVKAKFGPATLRIRSLHVEFAADGDGSDYYRAPSTAAQHGAPRPPPKGNER